MATNSFLIFSGFEATKWVQPESNILSTSSTLLLLFTQTHLFISAKAVCCFLCCVGVFLYCAQNKTTFHSDLQMKAMFCMYFIVLYIASLIYITIWCNCFLLFSLLCPPEWNRTTLPKSDICIFLWMISRLAKHCACKTNLFLSRMWRWTLAK